MNPFLIDRASKVPLQISTSLGKHLCQGAVNQAPPFHRMA